MSSTWRAWLAPRSCSAGAPSTMASLVTRQVLSRHQKQKPLRRPRPTKRQLCRHRQSQVKRLRQKLEKSTVRSRAMLQRVHTSRPDFWKAAPCASRNTLGDRANDCASNVERTLLAGSTRLCSSIDSGTGPEPPKFFWARGCGWTHPTPVHTVVCGLRRHIWMRTGIPWREYTEVEGLGEGASACLLSGEWREMHVDGTRERLNRVLKVSAKQPHHGLCRKTRVFLKETT